MLGLGIKITVVIGNTKVAPVVEGEVKFTATGAMEVSEAIVETPEE